MKTYLNRELDALFNDMPIYLKINHLLTHEVKLDRGYDFM